MTALKMRLAAGEGIWGTASDAGEAQLPSTLAGGDPTIVDRYEKEQMVAGTSQHQKVPHTDDAILAVLQFKAPAGAKADLAAPNTASATFEIAGVPGGSGTVYGPADSPQGINAAFTVDEYEYVVGYAPLNGQPGPGRAGVIKAAQAWYKKVSSLS